MTRRQRHHQLSQARVRLNRMARHQPVAEYRTDMKAGDIVRWRGDDGDYHVTLLELGYKWARVRFFGPGVLHDDGTRSPREKRVPVGDLEVSLWN